MKGFCVNKEVPIRQSYLTIKNAQIQLKLSRVVNGQNVGIIMGFFIS